MTQCRLCGGSNLTLRTRKRLPISRRLRKDASEPDNRYWVEWYDCIDCGLLQILQPIPAKELYDNNPWGTTGQAKPKHLDELIATVMARQEPGKAIDVGCNDGLLMGKLVESGYEAHGIEPNESAASLACMHGPVMSAYLTSQMAQKLGVFDTVFCRHVLEHIDDLHEFFHALRLLLTADGLLVIELPENHFLWEEHVSYFTRAQAERLLGREGFQVVDFRRYSYGGGSMAFVCRRFWGANHEEAEPVNVREAVIAAKSAGKRIVIYGASNRSVTAAHGMDFAAQIDAVLDDNPMKYGLLFPGTDVYIGGGDGRLSRTDSLCLLGVGKQAEAKVKNRMRQWVGPGNVDFISLVGVP